VSLTVICLIPRIPDRLMKAYTRISFPVNKLDMSSPEAFSTQSSVRFSHFTSVNVSRFYKILVKRHFCSNKISSRFQWQISILWIFQAFLWHINSWILFRYIFSNSIWQGISGGSRNMHLLAHLSWKLKWAFLIAFCPSSVCPSDVCLLDFYNFNFFFRTAGPILTKVGTNHP
jgi:hypothetical protein